MKAACERILQNRYDSTIRLELGDEISRTSQSCVQPLRVLNAPSGFPTKLSAKQVTLTDDRIANHPNTARFDSTQRFWNEYAALQFLGKVFGGDAPAPTRPHSTGVTFRLGYC
jgi:hypothetical protein